MAKPKCRFCKAPYKDQSVRGEFVYGGTEEHKFWHCEKCDLVYIFPLPSVEEEERFYAHEFEKYMEKRSGEDRDWSGPEEHIRSNQDNIVRRWKFMDDYIKEGQDVLEIGCSSGFMLDAFRDAGLNPVGIEPSGGFGDFLQKKGHIVFKSLNKLKMNYIREFDLICHFFLLEHIRDTVSFIQQQLSLLKPDGVIVAEVPCVNDPLTSLYEIPEFENFYWSIAHHYYFSPKSISKILDTIDCRYEIVPEQRYDLSNHLVWMQKGVPGGQGSFNHIFSQSTLESYRKDLVKSWNCDTFFLYIFK